MLKYGGAQGSASLLVPPTVGLSQSAFAAQLNVPLETYRPWDAGRREPPPQLLTRARTLAGYPDETVLLPLPVLALMIGVHVRTLHAAARSGRLGVAYDTRTTFRRLRPRATLKHALDFRRHYYGTQRRPPATPVPLTWASVPEDYDVQLKALRRHLDISQAGFARLVGAAGKAVVYQWEARKRTPPPLFWQRVHELQSRVCSERLLSPPPGVVAIDICQWPCNTPRSRDASRVTSITLA